MTHARLYATEQVLQLMNNKEIPLVVYACEHHSRKSCTWPYSYQLFINCSGTEGRFQSKHCWLNIVCSNDNEANLDNTIIKIPVELWKNVWNFAENWSEIAINFLIYTFFLFFPRMIRFLCSALSILQYKRLC